MSTWTPITPRSGGLVHITSLTEPSKTQCNKFCTGWRVALKQVDCPTCREGVHLPVKRKKKRVKA